MRHNNSGFMLVVEVFLERYAVSYTQIAHGRTPAQFKASGINPMVIEIECHALGLGVDIEANIKEGDERESHILLEGPDVFEVANTHVVAADDVTIIAGVGGTGRSIRIRIAADRIHAADVETFEDRDVFVGILEQGANASAHMNGVGIIEGIKSLPVGHQFDEVVRTAKTAAAPFTGNSGDGAAVGIGMRVRGIARDMRADGTGPVDALVIGDVRGSVLVNVVPCGRRWS